MADDPKPQSEVKMFDAKEHAAMKQALRDKDREDLRSNRATAAEIIRRNLFHGQVDMSRARIVHWGPYSGSGCIKDPKK